MTALASEEEARLRRSNMFSRSVSRPSSFTANTDGSRNALLERLVAEVLRSLQRRGGNCREVDPGLDVGDAVVAPPAPAGSSGGSV